MLVYILNIYFHIMTSRITKITVIYYLLFLDKEIKLFLSIFLFYNYLL